MVFILSDEVLEALKCSACKKYLSVKPVKVYPGNQIKCGRCSQPGDNGGISLYKLLAEESIFKCINRFDGCNKLLTYSEVQAHEQECFSNTHLCPFCGLGAEFATFLLPEHFKSQHPNECLDKPEVIIDLSSMEIERRYFYRQSDCLLIIDVKVSQSEDLVSFNIRLVGKETAAYKILYKLLIYSATDRRIIRVMKKRSCSALGTRDINISKVRYSDLANVDRFICKFEINTSGVTGLTILPKFLSISEHKNTKISYTPEQLEERLFPLPVFSEDIKLKYPNHFFSDSGRIIKKRVGANETVVLPLFCFFCHKKLVRPFLVVYKLIEISEYLCDKCSLVIFELFAEKIVKDLDIFDEITLSCRWGCGYVNGVDHNCENHPPRICPLTNCQQVGTLDELALHFQERHNLTFMAHELQWFSHELLESQTIIFIMLNRFVVLDVSVTNTAKLFTWSVIDKQYTSTRYTPIAVGVDFHKKKAFKHEYFFSITKSHNVFFHITLTN